jgi:uncharacterized protein YaiL (DUF2058 family)
MGTSLRDQLLKAGLVNAEQVKRAERERRKEHRDPKAASAAAKRTAEQARAQAAKTARDQEINRRNAAKAEAKAREAQVRQLVEQHRLPRSENENDTYYGFQDGKHVRRIAVADAQRQQLARGELVIARYGRSYALLPAAAAERVRERDPHAIVDLAPQGTSEPQDPNDPYTGFEVPDDLVW